MVLPKNVIYAGFWKRLVAFIIDLFIIIMAYVIVILLTAGSTGEIGRRFDIFYLLFTWLYFAILESSGTRATVGKRALNLIVTDLDGNQITFLRATIRHVGKFISTAVFLLGFIMAAFTERKQALHDIISSSLVLYNRDEPLNLHETKHS